MTRTKLVVGNWKMNLTAPQGVQLAQNIDKFVGRGVSDPEIVLAPPFTAIHSVATVIEFDRMSLQVAAQNLHWEDSGAYTGEISPTMLLAARVNYVIVGHSERREYFGESDQDINRKVKAALQHGLAPILCCGESLEVREEEQTLPFIEEQIREGLAGVGVQTAGKLVIAYEPIWAIGTGKTATPRMAEEVCAHIREVVADALQSETIAANMRILYGGSVNAGNAELFFAEDNIDGALVGGASLAAGDFNPIIAAAAK
ncbi:MAG: triose-phosphate isomerase [Coriobacteriia bacterium]|nr:triose-phosphate isomerase [Coriobacteriia bacterium]